VVMRSNLEVFLERLPVEVESAAPTLESSQLGPRRPAGLSPARAAHTREQRTTARQRG